MMWLLCEMVLQMTQNIQVAVINSTTSNKNLQPSILRRKLSNI